MKVAGVTHVLFDFFGTLVDYAPGGPSSAPECAALVRSYGADVDEASFSTGFDETFAEFEAHAAEDQREFSMTDVTSAFLRPRLGREPTAAEVDTLATTYVNEWNDGVAYRADTPAILAELQQRFRLAIVSNTHEEELVGLHVTSMGVTSAFDEVVTSVGVGWRKPHPAIYAEVLGRLGIGPDRAVFVGDTYTADFVGPEAYGIRAFLLDPGRVHPIPENRRLSSLADLPAKLS